VSDAIVTRTFPKRQIFIALHAAVCALGLAALVAAAPAHAQDPDVRTSAGGDAVSVHLGQSVIVQAPWQVARVAITDPDTADVQVLTPTEVLVIGHKLGTTDMILWSENDQVWHRRITVLVDLSFVDAELERIFPDCSLDVMQAQDVAIVSGKIRRAEQAVELRSTLESFDIKYVDRTSLAGVQQVAIKVRVAEVSRQAIRALGVNAAFGGDDFFGGLTIGPNAGGPLNPVSIGVPAGAPATSHVPFSFVEELGVASGITMFGGFPGADLELFLQALAENQYLRVLAEPTLVALSGEEATFLAGGEFPVPIVQGSAAGAGTTITIEYKEFGVRLRFVPYVLGDNMIRLRVEPEVSDLSDLGAVEIEGFRIPTLLTRRASTTLEMGSGQSFAMAGLLNQSTNARNSRVPLLGDLPVLGPLFRSVRYTQGETELVVLVTASLAEPSSKNRVNPVPGDLHRTPSDWELFINGKLEGPVNELSAEEAQWLKDLGFDQLQGPGAWARHGEAQPTMNGAH
jgi:pilus assembly protein CpaC